MRFILAETSMLTPEVCRWRLTGDTRGITRAGQFVQISVPGFYLRRPISVCDWHAGEDGALELIFKRVGGGTDAMAQMPAGSELDLLVGLGNGFDVNERDEANQSQYPLVVGGGVGAPPLYALVKRLLACLKKPTVVLGFGKAAEVLLARELEALGVPVRVTTLDGSAGERGLVTDAIAPLRGRFDYVYACGPEPMLRAVHALAEEYGIPGQYSFEERMACGFGVCMGCSRRTKYGYKRICKDGPVLSGEEIVW